MSAIDGKILLATYIEVLLEYNVPPSTFNIPFRKDIALVEFVVIFPDFTFMLPLPSAKIPLVA